MQPRVQRLRIAYQNGVAAPVPGLASSSSNRGTKSYCTASLGTPFVRVGLAHLGTETMEATHVDDQVVRAVDTGVSQARDIRPLQVDVEARALALRRAQSTAGAAAELHQRPRSLCRSA
jgi:hypothetical protein